LRLSDCLAYIDVAIRCTPTEAEYAFPEALKDEGTAENLVLTVRCFPCVSLDILVYRRRSSLRAHPL